MRVFILDDDIRRHYMLNARYVGAEIANAYNYNQAIDTVTVEPRFNVWQLDHDLDINVVKISDGFGIRDATGLDFCDWVEHILDRSKFPDQVIIHSWNPDGAKKMAITLQQGAGMRVYVQPFKEHDQNTFRF